MKINFNQLILDLHGKPMKNGEKPFLLRDACQEALTASYQDETTLSAAEKVERFMLALKINDPNLRPVEISIEEAATIKKLVGKAYGPIVVGRVFEILEDKTP